MGRVVCILAVLTGLLTGPVAFAQSRVEIFPGTSILLDAGSTLKVAGDIENYGDLGKIGDTWLGKIEFSHSATQRLLGTSPVMADTVILNNPHGVYLGVPLIVRTELLFQQGNLYGAYDQPDVYVEFPEGATYSGASDQSHINAWVRKTGTDAFEFPVGNAISLRPASISAPASPNAVFAAFYVAGDPGNYGYPTQNLDNDCNLNIVYNKEFWLIERLESSDAVSVGLSYGSSSGLTDLSQSMVVHWNGSKWESLGNGGISGDESAGSIVTGTGCGTEGSPQPVSSFSPFGFGGSDPGPLPITLESFQIQCFPEITVKWRTGAELNNQLFRLEYSTDAEEWTVLQTLSGQGNSNIPVNYSCKIDRFSGYLRLVQVDYDGQSEMFGPWPLNCPETLAAQRMIFPNPSLDAWNLQMDGKMAPHRLRLTNISGQEIQADIRETGPGQYRIGAENLEAGIYFLSFPDFVTLKLVKLP